MYWLRGVYYKMIRKITDIDHIEQFTGFGLYDKKFVDVVRDLHDPMPYLRGIIAELGFDYKAVPYTQPKRRAGKSKNNFYSLYDYAMIGITSYSKVVMRLATFAGFIIGGLSFLAAIVYLVLKLMYWDRFSAGVAPMVIGVFFLGALQLFFIGFLGEYVLSINTRVLDRPLVVEEERLNFDEKEENSLVKITGESGSADGTGTITPETLAAVGMLLQQYSAAARSAKESDMEDPADKPGEQTGV